MTKNNHLRLIIIFLAVSLCLITQIGAHADAIQKAPPSDPPFHVWLIQFVGGFTKQPVSQNVISGQKFELSAENVGGFGQFFNWGTTTWWTSTDEGKTWQSIKSGGNGASTFSTTVKTDHVQTIYYQVQSTYTMLATNTYWSNVAKVTVSPEAVAATGLNIDAPYDTLPNGSRVNMQPIFTPSNATDSVTWSIDRTDLASIDAQSGSLVAVEDNTKYGPVEVTATTASGLSASKTMYIGALQDFIASEGQNAIFEANGFPKGSEVKTCYQIDKNGKKTSISNNKQFSITNGPDGTKNGRLTINNSLTSQNGNHYLATIQIAGVSQATDSNSAKLTVIEGQQLSLDAVPNFTFTSSGNQPVSVGQLRKGITLQAIKPATNDNKQTFDGNNSNFINVYDPRPHSTGWRLSASLSGFKNQQTGDQLGVSGDNILQLIDSNQQSTVKLADDGQPTKIKETSLLNYSWAEDLTNSRLIIPPTKNATPGRYDASISWTLTVGPTPVAAK